jgi:hypothetical protein
MDTYEYIIPSTQEIITVETELTDGQYVDFDSNYEYFMPEQNQVISIDKFYADIIITNCGQKLYIGNYKFFKIISRREPTTEEYNSSLASYKSVWQFLGYSDTAKQKIIAYNWIKERKENNEQVGFYTRQINHIGLKGRVNIYPVKFLESLVERKILKL